MERVEAKEMAAGKSLYDELGRVQAQIAAAEGGDILRLEGWKNEAARLAMRSEAALRAIHEAIKQRPGADGQH